MIRTIVGRDASQVPWQSLHGCSQQLQVDFDPRHRTADVSAALVQIGEVMAEVNSQRGHPASGQQSRAIDTDFASVLDVQHACPLQVGECCKHSSVINAAECPLDVIQSTPQRAHLVIRNGRAQAKWMPQSMAAINSLEGDIGGGRGLSQSRHEARAPTHREQKSPAVFSDADEVDGQRAPQTRQGIGREAGQALNGAGHRELGDEPRRHRRQQGSQFDIVNAESHRASLNALVNEANREFAAAHSLSLDGEGQAKLRGLSGVEGVDDDLDVPGQRTALAAVGVDGEVFFGGGPDKVVIVQLARHTRVFALPGWVRQQRVGQLLEDISHEVPPSTSMTTPAPRSGGTTWGWCLVLR